MAKLSAWRRGYSRCLTRRGFSSPAVASFVGKRHGLTPFRCRWCGALHLKRRIHRG